MQCTTRICGRVQLGALLPGRSRPLRCRAAISTQDAGSAIKTELEATIGLETHVQLKTKTKTFCSCANEYGAPANTHICPVCMGHPGTLPVFNRRVVDYAIRMGLALHGEIASESKFDRKQYFYPDLPKGYQISQYDIPFCGNGFVEIVLPSRGRNEDVRKRIGIERMHIEEDAGKSIYSAETGRLSGSGSSLIDFNRAGVPLLEIVSKPDLASGTEAAAYGAELRRIVRYLGISDGNMEEGSMRCDVNISVASKRATQLGTKVEIKNMNSFSFIAKAIDYEYQRQSELIRAGRKEEIVQETRLWDESTSQTYTMRKKEGLADYRYFPEPDLPPLVVSQSWIETVESTRNEFPSERRQRYLDYSLSTEDVLVLTEDVEIGAYFDGAMKLAEESDAKALANWIMGDIMAHCKSEKVSWEALPLEPETLVEMVQLIKSAVISGKIAKQILPELLTGGGASGVKALVEAKGLLQISNADDVAVLIDEILTKNPQQVEAYRGGKNKLFGFFVGQVMKASKGRANPSLVNSILKEKLDG